jgi:hypothetical protein
MSSMVRTMKRAIKRRGIERSRNGFVWLARHNAKTESEDTYHKPKFTKEDIVK